MVHCNWFCPVGVCIKRKKACTLSTVLSLSKCALGLIKKTCCCNSVMCSTSVALGKVLRNSNMVIVGIFKLLNHNKTLSNVYNCDKINTHFSLHKVQFRVHSCHSFSKKVCDQLIELISITEMEIVSPLWHDMEFWSLDVLVKELWMKVRDHGVFLAMDNQCGTLYVRKGAFADISISFS